MPSHSDSHAVRAVIVKLDEDEEPWVACTMSLGTWDILDAEEWHQWKVDALNLCLADWQAYEIREATLYVPLAPLRAMFGGEVEVEVSS